MSPTITERRFVCVDCACENYNPGWCGNCGGRTKGITVDMLGAANCWRNGGAAALDRQIEALAMDYRARAVGLEV